MAVPGARAKVALASRIYVEGRHDAELVEQVWGDDLRVEGVVVEYLGGIDDLVAIVEEFRPGPVDGWACSSTTWSPARRRPASPTRSAGAQAARTRSSSAIRSSTSGRRSSPRRLGVSAWPVIPKGVDWKKGVCRALGWPHAQQADIARAWQRIRGRVRDWNDLEPALIGRVEELIDFVTHLR